MTIYGTTDIIIVGLYNLNEVCVLSKQANQKLKLLYIYKILAEETNEDNPITVNELISKLASMGINAERKSIYDDIEALLAFGADICTVRSRSNLYFMASRDFELPELKLLVDSVQSAKFITEKKSMQLIRKIEMLTSKYDAEKLNRQVYVYNRVKTLNEHIYFNVDRIHDAISRNNKISFKYFEYTVDKKKQYRKDGSLYVESPVSLCWDDENYYLIAYSEKYSNYVHYRVDKMESIEIIDEKRVLPDEEFNLAQYSKSMFSMYSGEKQRVEIQFDKSLVGVVIDRFGMDTPILKTNGINTFKAIVNVAVSPHFMSWIASFGKKAVILEPKSVRDDYKKFLYDSLKNYM